MGDTITGDDATLTDDQHSWATDFTGVDTRGSGGAPSDPNADAPADPIATAPSDPSADAPADPIATAPSDPSAAAPEDAGATAPSDPNADAPADPIASAPEDASTTAPPDPSTTAPEERKLETLDRGDDSPSTAPASDPNLLGAPANPTSPPRRGGVMVVIRQDTLVAAKCTGVLNFLTAAGAVMGKAGLLGLTTWDAKTGPELKSDSTGHVTDATYAVEITIRRAVGDGTWDANNTKAVHEVEALNRQHEHNHATDYSNVFNDNFGPQFINDLIAKTEKDARAAIQSAMRKLRTDMRDATTALDAREGKTFVQQNPDGTFTVTQVGA